MAVACHRIDTFSPIVTMVKIEAGGRFICIPDTSAIIRKMFDIFFKWTLVENDIL